MGLFSSLKKSKAPTKSSQGAGAGTGTRPTITATTSTNTATPRLRSPQKPIHAALEIPEIMERTFDFVDEYTLHHTVILVCYDWFWINQHRIVRKVNWFETSKTRRFGKVASRLPRATHMVLYTVSDDWNNDLARTLAKNHIRQVRNQEQGLHGPLGQDAYFQTTAPTSHHGMLKKRNPLQFSRILRDLDISGSGRLLWQLLPSLGSLTGLRVLFMEYQVFDVDLVLVACPSLVSLRLEFRKDGCRLQLSSTFTEDDAAASSPHLVLRTFIVEHVTITPTCLDHLLAISPRLKNLQLRNVCADKAISPPQIEQWSWLMTKLLAYKISLSSVHFSIKNGPPTTDEEAYEKIMMVAPRSQEWVWRAIDLTPTLTRCLRQLPNVVTHLELIQPFSAYSDGYELHQYLCVSPHLLHLKALYAIVKVERMDIHGRWTSPSLAHPSPPRIWACRNLRTLHITCYALGTYTLEDRKGRSRIFFGYISRVLPRLEDLTVLEYAASSPYLSLELQGGFCLLARLSQLTYLRIGDIDLKKVFKAADLRWIVPSGHINGGRLERSYLYRTWGDLLAEEAKTTARKKNVRDEDMTKDVELWNSLEDLGLLLDVKKMVDEMEANTEAYKGGMRKLRDLAIYRNLLSGPTRPEKEYLRLANDNFELKRESWRDDIGEVASFVVP
ncbi:hypothetical protein BGZ91_008390 [Linnemannia elongata]|nr:hypothetical protein BGZ91_008390 [Linnemannia elongata]